MLSGYLTRLREAAINRRAMDAPGSLYIIGVVVVGTLVFIGLAVTLIPADVSRNYHFYEGGPITALSAIFLVSAGAFSLATAAALIRTNGHHKWMWLILSIGFAFLALDELMEFHERVGRLLERKHDSGIFRSWDDIIVIFYGIAAVPVFLAILPGLIRLRMVLEIFTIAFLFYGIHTFVDSTSEPPTSTSVVVEESAKLLCGAFLAIGTFIGFLTVLWQVPLTGRPGDEKKP